MIQWTLLFLSAWFFAREMAAIPALFVALKHDCDDIESAIGLEALEATKSRRWLNRIGWFKSVFDVRTWRCWTPSQWEKYLSKEKEE